MSSGKDTSTLVMVGAFVLLWLAYRFGRAHAIAQGTWADWRLQVAKLRLLRKLRWSTLFAAVWLGIGVWVGVLILLSIARKG